MARAARLMDQSFLTIILERDRQGKDNCHCGSGRLQEMDVNRGKSEGHV